MPAQYGCGIFGATGTVGRAGLAAAESLGLAIDVIAGRNDTAGMLELFERCRPQLIVMADHAAAESLRNMLPAASARVEAGEDAACAAAAACSTMLAAVSGSAGLAAIMAALEAGRRVLLANKEALVLAGEHVLAAAQAGGGTIVPVDSEHNALAELLMLAQDRRERIARIWLTASGGPFFGGGADMASVTPAEAVRHPVWDMGAKISVDSATMMNKGLEVIEACRLFALAPEQIEVVVHPQAIVHAIVEFSDGGCIAQCAPADMRATLARAWAWPDVPQSSFGRISWPQLGKLEFLPPDSERFPCLRLAYDALARGGSAPAVLNAANEIAVESFLRDELGFADIPAVVARTVAAEADASSTLEGLLDADARARAYARQASYALAP